MEILNMKNIIKFFAVGVATLFMTTSCLEEITPQSNTVTADQAANAPGSYDSFVNAIISNLCGTPQYSGTDRPWDYGYPTFFLMRDVMGNDMTIGAGNNWYETWYTCGTGLGPAYGNCQVPWTIYYSWIKNCNTVLKLAGDEPDDDKKAGAGIAYCMRAFFYMDLARMFAQKPYTADKSAETVPIITGKEVLDSLSYNPRATNEVMWNFIVADLDKAEQYIAGYQRENVFTPDLSVVYGLKARAYLQMGEWAKAQEYAKKAQEGYTVMTDEEYTSRNTGFNTPNGSWMFGCTFKSDDACIKENDGDSSWGSWMILEVTASGCGYAADYGAPLYIDRHLYESIPESDFRKKCYIDFAIDEMESKEDAIVALSNYSDVPEGFLVTAEQGDGVVGGLPVKFRPKNGEHANQYTAFTVALPLMRVEEMKLIEAEAAGMQNEANGIALLTEFAKTRDADYVYGTHTDLYYTNLSQFQREVWWQRRVELWGEGFATLDIKRFQAGVIRSYAGSNHAAGYRWNVDHTPDWMNLCIVQTETNNNHLCTNNPTPLRPTEESPEFAW